VNVRIKNAFAAVLRRTSRMNGSQLRMYSQTPEQTTRSNVRPPKSWDAVSKPWRAVRCGEPVGRLQAGRALIRERVTSEALRACPRDDDGLCAGCLRLGRWRVARAHRDLVDRVQRDQRLCASGRTGGRQHAATGCRDAAPEHIRGEIRVDAVDREPIRKPALAHRRHLRQRPDRVRKDDARDEREERLYGAAIAQRQRVEGFAIECCAEIAQATNAPLSFSGRTREAAGGLAAVFAPRSAPKVMGTVHQGHSIRVGGFGVPSRVCRARFWRCRVILCA
jgi:hypothetical protein